MSDIFLKDEEIHEIFKSHLTIESKVMSIETLFANTRRQKNTVYDPYYQRNYVWDTDKASYFIESILLGTEIPPLVFFNTGKQIEVIDGRQRFETIKRFIENQFHLTNNGLNVLKYLKKKSFDDLPSDIKDIFWDTKLRIIEYGVVNEPRLDDRKEDLIKKEIFRRYNSGITPLKSVEVEKAKYIRDDTVSYFKNQLKQNKYQYSWILELFFLERDMELMEKSLTLEKVMDKIRTFLVLHNIPIGYFSTSKGRKDLIGRFFENLSNSIDDIEIFYNNFLNKIEFLKDLKDQFMLTNSPSNRLVFECLFWALSILENEKIDLNLINNPDFKKKLVNIVANNIDKYKTDNSHFYKEFNERYTFTASIFEQEFGISFDLYLNNKGRFKSEKLLSEVNTDPNKLHEFESLRLNKPDASTTTIEDICRQMLRQRFLVRPSYQRGEAINKVKSSALIESILLGIKLPPLFVYKRNDGISEVVDGQQRLLSILGFIGEEFTDEGGKRVKSEKYKFTLSKLPILNELNGKKFDDLPDSLKDKIFDFNLSVVNIDEKINPNFDPIDLFIRLNNKPYPIRENTFEMWNSYIDKEIISAIKENTQKHSGWFYSRKNNNRMENEELYTSLAYLEYKSKVTKEEVSAYLDIYKIAEKVNARIKDKNDITKILNLSSINDNVKSDFIKSIKNVESFIRKVKTVLIDKDTDNLNDFLGEELNSVFPKGGMNARRTLQNFYTLWYLLNNINSEMIRTHRTEIKTEITNIFELMKNVSNGNGLSYFLSKVQAFWDNFSIESRKITLTDDEKKELIKKQNNICPLCSGYLFSGDEIEVDHIKPLAVGGRDSFLNLQATHKECNRRKKTKY
ncbi:DUF262 domain-containing protein [Brevibacillus sp. MS2.2]|uniref:HNH endonuclease family protein n=1 Tax=Brevibacillus sp. MS2.2 TaxID=2738981 RepID=UPI00156BB2FC|nr:DUF262 domain-containing protein [Brevibacillus sp. MS2.2]NRR21143.1 DUF262 domain-containing protein [Brevibacillus sp. MS2.2]